MAIRTFLIAYETPADAVSIARLETAISEIGCRWARPLSDVWYIESIEDVHALSARLTPLLSDDDGLVIHEVAGRPGFHNTQVRWTTSYALRDRANGLSHVPSPHVHRKLHTRLSVVSSPL